MPLPLFPRRGPPPAAAASPGNAPPMAADANRARARRNSAGAAQAPISKELALAAPPSCAHGPIVHRRCRRTLGIGLLSWALIAGGWPGAAVAAVAPTSEATQVVGLAPVHRNTLRQYGQDEGLPQASVNAMLQTRDGFLWLGTFGGLIRFDGREFRMYNTGGNAKEEGAGPPSERVLALYEDPRGRLWVGTQEAGISIRERDRFRHLPVCGGTCQVAHFFSVDDRELWALSSHGIFKIDLESLEVTLHREDYNSFSSAVRMDGAIYAGGLSGLWRLSPEGMEEIPLPDGRSAVRRLSADSGTLWAVLDNGDLYRHGLGGERWTLVRENVPPDTQLLLSNDGRPYISDQTSGLRALGGDGRESPVPGADSLHAWVIHTDGEGNTWIGTTAQGLWRLRPPRVEMIHARQSGAGAPGRLVAGDGEGGVWLAFECAGLWHRRPDGTSRQVPLESVLDNECASSLLHDGPGGALWIGTSGAKLIRLKDDRLEVAASWPREGILNAWRARDGSFWASTSRHTYRLTMSEDGQVADMRTVPVLDGMNIAMMADARAGGAWFVGDRGAFRIIDSQLVEQWTPTEGIRGRFFRAIHEDDDGSLWIGTYGGGLVEIRDGRLRQHTEATGLFDNTVSCILPDQHGHLWLAGNRGLSVLLDRRIGPWGPKILTVSASDGLVPPEFNGGTASACDADHDGRLWFAMIRGFATVDPAQFESAPRRPPAAYIERVAVSGRGLDLFEPPILGVDASNLEIGFGAINLTDAQHTRFRYRIDGEGGEWIEADRNRSIMLPVVPWYRRQWIWLAASLAGLVCLLWATRERHRPDDYDQMLERIRKSGTDRSAG